MRVFIAIDIDRNTRKALGDLQQKLAKQTDIKKSDVKWVNTETVHLTLKFLGEVEDEKIAGICDIVKDAAAKNEKFELDIESVGCFGGRSARVLWVGAGNGKDKVCRLQKDIEGQLASAGWPEEDRQFTGHLTLCRIKRAKAGFKLAEISKQYNDFKIGTIQADSVTVYQSQLAPAGPVYTVLANYELQ